MNGEFDDDFEPTVVEDDDDEENSTITAKTGVGSSSSSSTQKQQRKAKANVDGTSVSKEEAAEGQGSGDNSNSGLNSTDTQPVDSDEERTYNNNNSEATATANNKGVNSSSSSRGGKDKGGFFYDNEPSDNSAEGPGIIFTNSPFGMIQAFLKKNKCKDMDALRLQREQRVRASMVTWRQWRDSPQIRDIKVHVLSKAAHTRLWWQGIPTNLRSHFWMRALDNALNVTPALYAIMLAQAHAKMSPREKSSSGHPSANVPFADSEKTSSGANGGCSEVNTWSNLIRSDAPRTFAPLQFFKAGGPYHDALRNVLEAYVCYRPDLGYVQGMTYLAATALLNLETPGDAFVFVANMLNSPVQRGFYAMDPCVIRRYARATTLCLRTTAPKLARRLEGMGITPEMYMVEWVMTVFSKVLPLDVAVHVWDMWLLEGDYFIFRTAVGLLAMYSDFLLLLPFEDVMRFLRNLPQDIIDEALFESIAAVPLNAKKFQAILDKCAE